MTEEKPKPTPKELKVLKKAYENGGYIQFHELGEFYSKGKRKGAARNLVKKGYLKTTWQCGRFDLIDTPWEEEGQNTLEGFA